MNSIEYDMMNDVVWSKCEAWYVYMYAGLQSEYAAHPSQPFFFQDGSSYFWQVRSDHFLHTKFGWGHEPLAPFHVHVFA